MKSYNLKDVIVTVGGVTVSGYADGDAVSVEMAGDVWELQKGSDGEGVRSRLNNDSGTIKFMLMYGSALNAYFNELYQSDKREGKSVVPIKIRDRNGGAEIFAPECFISAVPNVTFGRTSGTNEWTFTANDIDPKYGELSDSLLEG